MRGSERGSLPRIRVTLLRHCRLAAGLALRLLPRLAECIDERVTRVDNGRRHALVLVDVYPLPIEIVAARHVLTKTIRIRRVKPRTPATGGAVCGAVLRLVAKAGDHDSER